MELDCSYIGEGFYQTHITANNTFVRVNFPFRFALLMLELGEQTILSHSKRLVIRYICVKGVDNPCFCDFLIGIWNCSEWLIFFWGGGGGVSLD